MKIFIICFLSQFLQLYLYIITVYYVNILFFMNTNLLVHILYYRNNPPSHLDSRHSSFPKKFEYRLFLFFPLCSAFHNSFVPKSISIANISNLPPLEKFVLKFSIHSLVISISSVLLYSLDKFYYSDKHQIQSSVSQ